MALKINDWKYNPSLEIGKTLFGSLLEVLEESLTPNNTVTNLELKNKLRSKHPFRIIYQKDISEAMDYLQDTYNQLTYTSNGVFRIYSLKIDNTQSPITTDNVITKDQAKDMIGNSQGKYFGVTFIKIDGNIRSMRCKAYKDTKIVNNKYLQLIDAKYNHIKNINLDTLKELRINKNIYTVA